MQRYFIKNKDMLLEESDIRHIKKVMRMNINDKIEVVYNNKLHICEITSLEPFNIKVIEKLDEDKKTKIELTVAVALVKEQKMDLILQKLTELGVSRIIPVSMERSIVKSLILFISSIIGILVLFDCSLASLQILSHLTFFIALTGLLKSLLTTSANALHSSDRFIVFHELSVSILLIIPASLIKKTAKLKNGRNSMHHQCLM